MLELTVRISDNFNNETQQFEFEDFELKLEHSLISLSKWEQKYEKAYLGLDTKSSEEVEGYVRCMIINDKYPEDILDKLNKTHVAQIEKYLNAKMTATTINDIKQGSGSTEKITSELIYFWIVSYNIPWDVEHWHLNRLFTLLRLFGAKQESQQKKKRMTPAEIAQRNRQLNEQRRAATGSKG